MQLMCAWQVVANQDTASRQLGAMRAEIIALQQELMQYRMVFVVIAVDAPSSVDKVHLTGDDDDDVVVVVLAVVVVVNNNNNSHNDIYSAVIMTRSLREFTRFIW